MIRMKINRYSRILAASLLLAGGVFSSCGDDDKEDIKTENNGQNTEKKTDIFADLNYDEMIYVEGGTFLMGAQSQDKPYSDWQGEHSYNYDADARKDESPVHTVTLSSYYIGKYEVTREIWEYVMSYNGNGTGLSPIGPYFNTDFETDFRVHGNGSNYPVYDVSYNDIVNYFLPRLNKITGKTFRLPTEAEWEYAARGGDKSESYKYSGSNDIDSVAWYYKKSTYNVGGKAPNKLGIYDMSGNVWEWCSDWYAAYDSTAQTNPTGVKNGEERVLRGGSGDSNAKDCRVSNRSYYNPDHYSWDCGLRLVLDAD